MREPNDRDKKAYCDMRKELSSAFIRRNMGETMPRDKDIIAAHFAAYREEIESPLRAEIERLREALKGAVKDCEVSHHYCDRCGADDPMTTFDIYATLRAALAPSAPEESKP